MGRGARLVEAAGSRKRKPVIVPVKEPPQEITTKNGLHLFRVIDEKSKKPVVLKKGNRKYYLYYGKIKVRGNEEIGLYAYDLKTPDKIYIVSRNTRSQGMEFEIKFDLVHRAYRLNLKTKSGNEIYIERKPANEKGPGKFTVVKISRYLKVTDDTLPVKSLVLSRKEEKIDYEKRKMAELIREGKIKVATQIVPKILEELSEVVRNYYFLKAIGRTTKSSLFEYLKPRYSSKYSEVKKSGKKIVMTFNKIYPEELRIVITLTEKREKGRYVVDIDCPSHSDVVLSLSKRVSSPSDVLGKTGRASFGEDKQKQMTQIARELYSFLQKGGRITKENLKKLLPKPNIPRTPRLRIFTTYSFYEVRRYDRDNVRTYQVVLYQHFPPERKKKPNIFHGIRDWKTGKIISAPYSGEDKMYRSVVFEISVDRRSGKINMTLPSGDTYTFYTKPERTRTTKVARK